MSQNAAVAEILKGSKHHYSTPTPALVNDTQAEYVVHSIKHFFDKFIVVQYQIQNTLEDQILSNLELKITGIDDMGMGLQVLKVVHLGQTETIKYNERKYVYAVFTKQGCSRLFP